MINESEYNELCKLIKKGDLNKLQGFVDLSHARGRAKYLKEAREVLKTYLEYYPQPFIAYINDSKVKENSLVESLFNQKNNNSEGIVISDNVSGGFILYSDEILDESTIQREHILRTKGLSLSATVDSLKMQHLNMIIEMFGQIDKKKFRLIIDEEKTKKVVKVYGNGYSNPHNFERTRYDSLKILGEDAKLYISSPKSDPLIYGESSKGKALLYGLRK